MTTLLAPGKSEAEIREAIDARHAARWYCLTPWACQRCMAMFGVEPQDFRETVKGTPKALECLRDIYGDPKFVLALCPACGKQNERPAPETDPAPDEKGGAAAWWVRVLAIGVVLVAWLAVMASLNGWW